MMNNNLTTKFMEGLQAAQKAAQSAGRAQIYPAELLLALVQQEGGVLSAVLTRAGVDSTRLQRELEQQLESFAQQYQLKLAEAQSSVEEQAMDGM